MAKPSEFQKGSALWDKETVRERIQKIPELIDLLGGFNQVKFRLALDYDPALPNAPFSLEFVPVIPTQSAHMDSLSGK